MGLLDRVEQRASLESPSVSLSHPPAWLLDAFGAQPTASGIAVSEQSALRYSAVWACQKILSETIAALPLKVYRRLNRGRAPATDHWLSALLAEPHPDLTPYQFMELLVAHLMIWGNAYFEIETMGGGLRPKALHPLLPHVTRAKRREFAPYEKYYVTRIKEGGAWRDVELPKERVLHIPGLGYDGLMGYSPIAMARQGIALGLAAEQFGASFYPNGSHIGLVLTHPQTLSPAARENLRLSVEMMHQGLDRAHRAAVFEEGVKVERLGIPQKDAQYMELRKFQIVEVARCYRMPLHKLLDYEHATFSNVEHLGIEFATDTIAPPSVRIQQAITKGLLSERERKVLYCEFTMAGLLRGDVKSRAEANAVAVQNGWKTRNQVREEDNENPIPEEEGGDEYTVQLNMIPLRLLGKELEESEPEGEDESESGEDESAPEEEAGRARAERLRLLLGRVERSYRRILEEDARRVVTRQANALRKAITRPEPDLRAWARDFYGRDAANVSQVTSSAARSLMDSLVGHVADALLPGDEVRSATLLSRLETVAPAETMDFGERTAAAALAAVEAALSANPAEAGATLSRLVEEWERSRPAVLARDLMRASRSAALAIVCDSLGMPELRRQLMEDEPC